MKYVGILRLLLANVNALCDGVLLTLRCITFFACCDLCDNLSCFEMNDMQAQQFPLAFRATAFALARQYDHHGLPVSARTHSDLGFLHRDYEGFINMRSRTIINYIISIFYKYMRITHIQSKTITFV